jgi:uncharacterized repeat protein (TIGR04042 family)
MPELHFRVRWPDGTVQRCYSPSRSVKDFLTVGESYAVEDFVGRSRRALELASERVRARRGFACGSAARQLEEIERAADGFVPGDGARVTVEGFEE